MKGKPEVVETTKQFEELLTLAELSQHLKVPASWIYSRSRSTAEDAMPVVRVGKYLRFDLPDVRGWLQRQGK